MKDGRIRNKEGIYILEAARYGQRLKISGFERTEGEERPVKNYKEVTFNEDRIRNYSGGIRDLLNRANKRGQIGNDLLVKLKDLGRLLFDELIPMAIKESLIRTDKKNLMISVDDWLVHVPWELLHDGKEFLCLRFSIGRSVSTKQQVSAAERVLGRPITMQLLADPRGDLEASYRECVEIKNEIGRFDDWINISLKTTDIRTDYVKAKILNFDIVHYAGHAEHDGRAPEKSGWMLRDGKLCAREIMNMAGTMPMPSLVFSNACQSGQTDEWKLEEDYENRIFGLANAFLLSGVQHYIGTFWEIPDQAGSYFAVHFYKNIMQGHTIGEAVRQARLALIGRYGEDMIVWASYMLYGDPATRYVYPGKAVREEETAGKPVREEPAFQEMRHRGEVIDILNGKKKMRNRILTGACLFLIVAAGILYTKQMNSDRQSALSGNPVHALTPSVTGAASPVKRIDMLVASLAWKYREGDFAQDNRQEDGWTTQPLTMVLTDVMFAGDGGRANREMLLRLLPQNLEKESRVNIIERDLIEKLLEELNLSTSELADPSTALKIGKVLSAMYIISGSIIPRDDKLIVILRCIDTETTEVKKVISAESSSTAIDREIIDSLGEQILHWVRNDFPLQGRVVSVSGNTVQVNLGEINGLKKGDRLEVIGESLGDPGIHIVIGEVEINEVGENKSRASIKGDTDVIKEGARVLEIKENK
jgi:CHAT domain-containing protein